MVLPPHKSSHDLLKEYQDEVRARTKAIIDIKVGAAQHQRALKNRDLQAESSLASEENNANNVTPLQKASAPTKTQQVFSDSGYSSGHYPTTAREAPLSIINESNLAQALVPNIVRDDINYSIQDDQSNDNHDVDIETVASDMEDIQPEVETQRSHMVVAGEQELQRLFIQNHNITDLARRILERTDRARFLIYFRRLLNRYYKDLRQNALSSGERVAAELLRSRSARSRLAEALLDNISPTNEEKGQEQAVTEKTSQTDKRRWLETWIAKLPDSHQDNTPSDDTPCIPGEELSESGNDKFDIAEARELVHITKLKSFFSASTAFDTLLLEMALLVIPPSLKTVARTLMGIPSSDIVTQPTCFQRYLASCLHWFRPASYVRPTVHSVTEIEKTISWRCYCNQVLSVSLTQKHWLLLVDLLEFKKNKCYGQNQCKEAFLPLSHRRNASIDTSRTTRPEKRKQPNPSDVESHIGSGNKVSVAHGINITSVTNPPVSRSPSARSSSASSSNQSASTSATSISSASIYMPGKDLIVLFGAKGRSPYVHVEHIDTKNCGDDSKFFRQARMKYCDIRGYMRYFLSVWQFDHCKFVKFTKNLESIVSGTFVALPFSPDYQFQPRPPDASAETQIDLHTWSVVFSKPCSETVLSKLFGICIFSWMHEWIHVCIPALRPGRADLLNRIPRKDSPWLTDQPGIDEAYGIQAIDMPSPFHLFLYYILILTGPSVYWVRWYSVYNDEGSPPDLHNPSVPLLVVISVLIAPLAAWQAMISASSGKVKGQ